MQYVSFIEGGNKMARFQVKLQLKKVYSLGDPIEVTVKIRNRTKFPYYLLKQSLGMDELDSDCFQVTYEGREIEYDGFLVKRDEMCGLEDYILLNAGECVSINICLAKNYMIDKAGYYKLRFNRMLQCMRVDKTGRISRIMYEEAECREKGFYLLSLGREMCATLGQTERGISAYRMEQAGLRNVPEYYAEPDIRFDNDRGCSDEFKEKFKTATRKAHYILANYLYHSNKELSLGTPAARRANLHYQMVFGDYDETRYQTVQGVYDKVEEVMRREKLVYIYKERDEATYGYTTKGSRTIYLCQAYVRAALTGEDSKMGTLLHELTHAAAYTDDVYYDDKRKCYGRTCCRNMAKTHPDSAVKNADSYEFFLESKFLNRMTEVKWSGTEDAASLEYGGPAVAVNGELVYLFYVDKTDHLKFSLYHKDTGIYDKPKEVTDESGKVLGAKGHPVVLFADSNLYLFFLADEKLMMCRYLGEKFTVPVSVLTKKGIEIRPAYLSRPVLYHEKINFVYRKKDGLGIFHLAGDKDAEEWEEEKEIGGSPAENFFHYNPAMCVYKRKLYLFYQIAQGTAEQRGELYYAHYDEEKEEWKMNIPIKDEIIQPVKKGRTCYPIEAYSAVCAESYDDTIALIFREKDSEKTIQLQMHENVFLKGQREWTDLERLERSSMEGLRLKQDLSYDIASDKIFQYMVYMRPGVDGVYISTKMR